MFRLDKKCSDLLKEYSGLMDKNSSLLRHVQGGFFVKVKESVQKMHKIVENCSIWLETRFKFQEQCSDVQGKVHIC